MAKEIKNISLSSNEIDVQEHLSIKRLQKLSVQHKCLVDVPRPKDSYIELIQWIEKNFCSDILSGPLHRFVHNKIIMDGSFVQFCEERSVEIKPLLVDGIVSWKSEASERFFIQGIFVIEKDGVKFIHSALYHKGNQNEDEISFCIFVDDAHYESYLEFRNEFDEWSAKRDRSNLVIRVVDGEDIPYTRDLKWDDLFLPEDLKLKIRQTIEGFLKSKSFYESKKIPWKRGLIFWGVPGNGKTSLIKTIMSNYDFKPVTIMPGSNDDSIREAFAYAQEQSPALLFFEDLDVMLENINISLFLNLLDGVSNKNGMLVVATTNNIDALKNNIKNRPSRFDRNFEIPLPNEDMTKSYIKKWFGKVIPEKELSKIISVVNGHGFSYSHLKDLYISAIYLAIADDRQEPSIIDINTAINQIIEDNFSRSKRVIGIDKYLDNKKPKNKK